MTDRLTDADLARMRAEHVPVSPDGHIWCRKCLSPCSCDAIRLLDHFAPGPVPPLAGLAYGLYGPSVSDELTQ